MFTTWYIYSTSKAVIIRWSSQIVLVSHSMGGLLVRSYLTSYPSHAKKYVEAWVTIGTPFLVGLCTLGLLRAVGPSAFGVDAFSNLMLALFLWIARAGAYTRTLQRE